MYYQVREEKKKHNYRTTIVITMLDLKRTDQQKRVWQVKVSV